LLKGQHHTEEANIKNRESHLGKTPWNKGKKTPEEVIKKLKESWSYEKHITPEMRRKCRESSKDRKHSKETCDKLSEIAKCRPPISEKTRQKLSEWQKGEKSWNWKGGISFEPYCIKFDKPFKERCRNFFGRKCVECGKTELENKKRLSVHHVNFDKMACCNNGIPLFVALCASCHAKTNHNGEYWEQHFTEMIIMKYSGQCYLPKDIK